MNHLSLRSYVSGFILSLYFTLTAYLLAVRHVFFTQTLVIMLAGLALAQFFVQLLFFLHLGTETKPRWKLMVFLFMIMVVLILVVGSLWIMSNLNYHQTPAQVNDYLRSQDSL